jgi:hypothetical protein
MFNIRDVRNADNRQFSSREMQEFETINNQQQDNEVKFIDTRVYCEYPLKDVLPYFPSLNGNELKKRLSSQFYDVSNLHTTMCLTNSLISVSPEWRDYFTTFFTNLKKIGGVTSNGFALRTSLTNTNNNTTADNIFVIKVPQLDDISELQHEFVVGFILNALRKDIPNFSAVYGFLRCPKAILNQNGNATSVCSF